MNAVLEQPLESLKAGSWAEVTDVSGTAAWVARMAELGLREGTQVHVVKSGCPCLVDLGCSRLCFRCTDDGMILAKPIDSP
ncbi:MAG: ferrous iron transport protein A [Gemmataceae bacterium]|nr:ferrous iron transport protein A [Gemmataceae bacterium]